jgi:hypothetical protein
MLSRLHSKQQALLAKAGPSRGHKPQQQPVTRALIVLPYLSIGMCWGQPLPLPCFAMHLLGMEHCQRGHSSSLFLSAVPVHQWLRAWVLW